MRILILLLFLTGCYEYDRKLQAEVFDKCLMRAAEARSGGDYTTHDDEDFDEVVKQCSYAAGNMAIRRGK